MGKVSGRREVGKGTQGRQKGLKRPVEVADFVAMSTAAPSRDSRPGVLFVDDEREVTEGIRRALRRERFRIYTANSVPEAQTVLARESVQVVVSDEKMPGTSGSQFLVGLRSDRPEVTRILLTGQGDLNTVQSALNEAEIFRFLTKPCRPEKLRASVEDALDAHARYRAWSESVARDALARRLDAAFDQALEHLWLAAQPIVTATGEAYAWECLARVASPDFKGPAGLFAMAADLGRTSELEHAILARVAAVAAEAPPGSRVFCNIEAATLLDDHLYDPCAPLSQVADRVVIEVTEREQIGRAHV